MLAAWKEAGIEPPEEYQAEREEKTDAPPLSYVASQYLTIYREMMTCRQLAPNGQPLPVPFSAIQQVTASMGYAEELMDVLYIVRVVDAEFLTLIKEQSE